jgi:hypothetical protein
VEEDVLKVELEKTEIVERERQRKVVALYSDKIYE